MLLDIIQKSDSNEIVKYVSSNMSGKTFHHHYHILYDIRTLLGESKKVYTEIGTYCGGSLSLMLHHTYDTDIYCIDPLHVLQNQEQYVNENISKFNKDNKKVSLYKNFSTDRHFHNHLVEQKFNTDILFIDGDHSYKGVLNDFYNYEIFVNSGGYIIFDDYLDYKYSPEVRKAVDFIVSKLDTTKYEIIGLIPNYKNSFVNDTKELIHLNEFVIKKY
jgi:predicted O-methyltransferase YrrM